MSETKVPWEHPDHWHYSVIRPINTRELSPEEVAEREDRILRNRATELENKFLLIGSAIGLFCFALAGALFIFIANS